MTAARRHPFFDPATHGFLRVGVAMPRCRVADPAFNAAETIRLLRSAEARGARLVAFPELGLSAYTCDDLFHQRALLDASLAALGEVAEATRDGAAIAVVGLPFVADHALFNCAAVVAGGRVRGIVPKTYLPNYGEFYEARQFTPGDAAISRSVRLLGDEVPFGNDLVFEALLPHGPRLPGAAATGHFRFHVEICEDLWVPIPPSSFAALAGATVLVNLSASNITIGKSDYRHRLVGGHSARSLAAGLYSSAGFGESTTDLAWDGQGLIYEGGELLAESERFSTASHVVAADVDLERLSRERMRQTSFGASMARHREAIAALRIVAFDAAPAVGAEPKSTSAEPLVLERPLERFPYVPADPSRRDERCREVFDIQVQALSQRIAASGIGKLVIGVSGGLDSTHALLVCAQALDALGRPRSDILGVTMPGFATSARTLDQARRLMAAIGCDLREIDIRPSCEQMLADIRHPHSRGEAVYDVAFENVQAGERTSHLFRIANFEGGLVVGTGDLSELALGWCTYGVGDHMSHYNVNASVPKTLVEHLVRWVAETRRLGEASRVLVDIVETEVSPELVPGDAADRPHQSTEAAIGPYALHDFFLYHVLRFGFAPEKVAFLAWSAWHDGNAGRWPGDAPDAIVDRAEYSLAEIRRHLATFLDRFFRSSQFKRSCVPNAPKVGSGGSLSPRGDWRAPSDADAATWLARLDRVPPDE